MASLDLYFSSVTHCVTINKIEMKILLKIDTLVTRKHLEHAETYYNN